MNRNVYILFGKTPSAAFIGTILTISLVGASFVQAQTPYGGAISQPAVYTPPHANSQQGRYTPARNVANQGLDPRLAGYGVHQNGGSPVHYHGGRRCSGSHQITGAPGSYYQPAPNHAAALYSRQQATNAHYQRNRSSRNSKLALFAIGAVIAIALSQM